MTLYDRIAGIYDPWSRSVTEDVDFYVERALAVDGPVVELAVGTGRIAIPVARRGHATSSASTPRRRCSPSRVRRPTRPASRTSSTSASATCASRPSRSASTLVLCPFRSLLHMRDGGREAPRAARGAQPSASPAAASSSTSSRRAAKTSRRRTGAGWSASPGSSSGPTGTRRHARSRSPCARTTAATTFGLHWLSAPEWLRLLDEAGARRRGVVRLVRRPTVRRRRGHGLRHPSSLESRSVIAVIVILVVLVLLALLAVALFNRLVRRRNRVDNAWAQVEVQLKRRWDLIPNLVETVKGYAAHERGTFEAVTQARAAAQKARRARRGGAGGRHPQPGARAALRGRGGVSGAPRDARTSRSCRRSSPRPRTRSPSAGRSTTTPCSRTTTRSRRSPAAVSRARSASSMREFFEVEDAAQRDAPSVDFGTADAGTTPGAAESAPASTSEPSLARSPCVVASNRPALGRPALGRSLAVRLRRPHARRAPRGARAAERRERRQLLPRLRRRRRRRPAGRLARRQRRSRRSRSPATSTSATATSRCARASRSSTRPSPNAEPPTRAGTTPSSSRARPGRSGSSAAETACGSSGTSPRRTRRAPSPISYTLRGLAVAYDDVVDVNLKVWGDQWDESLAAARRHRERAGEDPARLGPSRMGARRRRARRARGRPCAPSHVPAHQFVELRTLIPRSRVRVHGRDAASRRGNALDRDRRRGDVRTPTKFQQRPRSHRRAQGASAAHRPRALGARDDSRAPRDLRRLLVHGPRARARATTASTSRSRRRTRSRHSSRRSCDRAARPGSYEFTATLFDLDSTRRLQGRAHDDGAADLGGPPPENDLRPRDLGRGRTASCAAWERDVANVVDGVLDGGSERLSRFRDKIEDDREAMSRRFTAFKEHVGDEVGRRGWFRN